MRLCPQTALGSGDNQIQQMRGGGWRDSARGFLVADGNATPCPRSGSEGLSLWRCCPQPECRQQRNALTGWARTGSALPESLRQRAPVRSRQIAPSPHYICSRAPLISNRSPLPQVQAPVPCPSKSPQSARSLPQTRCRTLRSRTCSSQNLEAAIRCNSAERLRYSKSISRSRSARLPHWE